MIHVSHLYLHMSEIGSKVITRKSWKYKDKEKRTTSYQVLLA